MQNIRYPILTIIINIYQYHLFIFPTLIHLIILNITSYGNILLTQNKVTSLFGFGGTVNIDIILDPTQRKKFWSCKGSDGKRVKLPIYIGEEDISGVVALQLQDTKKFEHLGVKIDLIGHLGTSYTTQKSTLTKTYQQTLWPCPSNLNLQAH